MKHTRPDVIKKRKNFLPAFLITVCLLGFLILIIIYLDPTKTGAVPLFFSLLFMTLIFILSMIFVDTRKGVTVSSCIVLLLILRYFDLANLFTLIFLALITALVIKYLRKDEK